MVTYQNFPIDLGTLTLLQIMGNTSVKFLINFLTALCVDILIVPRCVKIYSFIAAFFLPI